jgi:alkenylglycerophosphocholine/alkenylglycerophosphoethanolamine hydrolase
MGENPRRFALHCGPMRASRILLALSVASVVVYLVTTPWRPYPGSPAIKGCTVGALALLAFLSRGRRRDAGLLALGLVFSMAGDVLLDLDPQWFVFGLVAFLLAHLTYITLFVRNRARPFHLSPSLAAAVVLVLASSATLSAWIVPSAGDLAVPVIVYVCALTTMVITAIAGRFEGPWVALGAVLFMISDSLLAINKFKTPLPLRDYLVTVTYYLGQWGIALGFLGGSK